MGCEAGGSVDVRIPNSDQQSSPTSPPVGATHGQTLESAAHAAHEFWAHRRVAGEINERAEDRYRRALDAFLRFAAAHDVTAVSGVTGALCAAWVAAPSSAERPGSRARPGQPASAATRRGRLVVLRATLTVWSTKGWIEPGLAPTDVIPKSPPRPPCPLTPAEVRQIQASGRGSAGDTLLPAIVALGLAGSSGTEIATAFVDAFDPVSGTLRLSGRGQRRPRTIALDGHARLAIATHIRALGMAAARRHDAMPSNSTPLALAASTF